MRALAAFLDALETAADMNAARDLFSQRIRAMGYHYFDVISMISSMLATPEAACRFFLCDYFSGNYWKYLPQTWPADDPAALRAAKSARPFDYVACLRECRLTPSVIVQRNLLRLYNIRRAWLIPMNTVDQFQCVTVYMRGGGAEAEARFHRTVDELFLMSAALIDRLEALYQAEPPLAFPEAEEALVEALSEQQLACLSLLAAGKSNAEMAEILGLTPHTVRYHLKKLFKALGVTSRAAAVAAAMKRGIIQI